MGEQPSLRIAAALILAAIALLPRTVAGGTVWFATPSLAATAIYDDNLFASATDPRRDTIYRLTPAIEAGYRSAPLTLRGLYTFDAETYAEHPELDNHRVREHAALDFLHRRTRMLTLGASAGYTRTQTPGELSPETGLDVARARAEQFTLSPTLAYQFDRQGVGSASYRFTRDKLAGESGSDTHLVGLTFDRRVSRRNTFSTAYTFRRFLFEDEEEDSSTHTLVGGGTHDFTPQTSFTLLGGPRFSDGEVDPEVSALLRHALQRGELSLGYTRTETTVIGQVGTATTESVSAVVNVFFGPSVAFRLAPSALRNTRGELQADVYLLNLDLGYHVTRYLSILGSYYYSSQRGRIDVPGDERIARNVFSLAIVIAPPPERSDSAPRTRARFPSVLDREWRLKQTESGPEEEP